MLSHNQACDVVIDKFQLTRSRGISTTTLNLRLGVKEDFLKTKNSNEGGFDLDPEWKNKHLSYTIKPVTVASEDYRTSFISKDAPSTCPTSIKSLDGLQRQIKQEERTENSQYGFKSRHLEKSEKCIPSNSQTLSEHRRQTLCTPFSKLEELSLNRMTQSKCLQFPSSTQPRTPQYSKNRQQKSGYFERYLEAKNNNKKEEIGFSKVSSFKSLYKENKDNNPPKNKGHNFPNMKTVESEGQEDEENVNSSIVIAKCLIPSQLTFKEGMMFKSHLKEENKKTFAEDLILRRKTTGDIKDLLINNLNSANKK